MKKIIAVLSVLALCLCAAEAEYDGDVLREIWEPIQSESAPQTYILHVVDQDDDPVPGVYVNFCTDTTCSLTISDESGIITFDGAPDEYHVQLLKVPDGYSFNTDYELYTDSEYGVWLLRVQKNTPDCEVY